jgi:hypothetical protein
MVRMPEGVVNHRERQWLTGHTGPIRIHTSSKIKTWVAFQGAGLLLEDVGGTHRDGL